MQDFKKSVVYQIYPKSFLDTNGDGLGDLQGVISKLDYLQTLGVDYIWLTPFFVSPQNDNGYDVADYRAIDPRYGTMADFEDLVEEAGRRNIRVMLDMVFNHTSTYHRVVPEGSGGRQRLSGLLHLPPRQGRRLRPHQLGEQVRRQRLGVCAGPGQVLPPPL